MHVRNWCCFSASDTSGSRPACLASISRIRFPFAGSAGGSGFSVGRAVAGGPSPVRPDEDDTGMGVAPVPPKPVRSGSWKASAKNASPPSAVRSLFMMLSCGSR